MYNGGQKISSTTVIPLTYVVKHPLGTNNLTSHVDMCQSNCVLLFLWVSDKISNFILQTSIIMTINYTSNFCEMTGKGWTKFFARNSTVGCKKKRELSE
jgi:hypothetical protein